MFRLFFFFFANPSSVSLCALLASGDTQSYSGSLSKVEFSPRVNIDSYQAIKEQCKQQAVGGVASRSRAWSAHRVGWEQASAGECFTIATCPEEQHHLRRDPTAKAELESELEEISPSFSKAAFSWERQRLKMAVRTGNFINVLSQLCLVQNCTCSSKPGKRGKQGESICQVQQINALITLFLDRRQIATQLTALHTHDTLTRFQGRRGRGGEGGAAIYLIPLLAPSCKD